MAHWNREREWSKRGSACCLNQHSLSLASGTFKAKTDRQQQFLILPSWISYSNRRYMSEWEKLITIFSINRSRKVWVKFPNCSKFSNYALFFPLVILVLYWKLAMNNIQWIYEHPENSGCKLIKKQAELVWRLWAKDRLLMVMGNIYMNSKSGFVPAIRNLRQTIKMYPRTRLMFNWRWKP